MNVVRATPSDALVRAGGNHMTIPARSLDAAVGGSRRGKLCPLPDSRLVRAATRAILARKPPTLPPPFAQEPKPAAATATPTPTPKPVTAPVGAPEPLRGDASERDRIIDALVRAGGNQKKAAELLGVSRRTLINRLDEYGIPRPRKK